MDMLRAVWAWICDFATEYIVSPVKTMGWLDALDIVLLATILCCLYYFCRNRRAGRVLLGLALVIVFVVVVDFVDLPALQYISGLFRATAFFCIVVIFQPEIRDALERLGNSSLLNPRSQTISRRKYSLAREVVDETTEAVFQMASEKTGALIVFEGLTKLGDYIKTGKPVDAAVSSELLQNLFFKNAPLHDGALIIRDMRIHAASCVLPANRGDLDFGSMGTRHRAAVGVTEVSDALVVVVSEQTGVVSVAQNGKLLRDVDEKALKDILMTYIAGNPYLRQKKANMRSEYLQMMDNIGKGEASESSVKKKSEKESPAPQNAEKNNTDAVMEEVFFEGQETARDSDSSGQDL